MLKYFSPSVRQRPPRSRSAKARKQHTYKKRSIRLKPMAREVKRPLPFRGKGEECPRSKAERVKKWLVWKN